VILPEPLQGTYHVRVFREARDLIPRARERALLRDQVLKLRYFPRVPEAERRKGVLDLDCDWVRSRPKANLGELRIHEVLGGCDNLRVLFWVPSRSPGHPAVWVLTVFQKKTQALPDHAVRRAELRRQLLIERFYNDVPDLH